MGEEYKVVELNTDEKWWDRWFVVANLTIDHLLADYNYFSMSSVYLITNSSQNREEFMVRKPRRDLRGAWSKCDILTFIDNLGGVLTEVEKVCGNDVYAVTQQKEKVNGVWKQKIYIFFAVVKEEDALTIERYLNDNNYSFIMADDVPFCD